MSGSKRGLYASYNESVNGPLTDAVAISKKFGCVTWLDPFTLDPTRLDYPTGIIIRVSGKEKYYRGLLLAVARADDLGEDFAAGERNHRPAAWQQKDREGPDFLSVLFIHGLEEESVTPPQVVGRQPPQHPEYIDVDIDGHLGI